MAGKKGDDAAFMDTSFSSRWTASIRERESSSLPRPIDRTYSIGTAAPGSINSHLAIDKPDIKGLASVAPDEPRIDPMTTKGRNNKGSIKAANEGHIKRKTEPSTRELRRKNMVKKIKRLR